MFSRVFVQEKVNDDGLFMQVSECAYELANMATMQYEIIASRPSVVGLACVLVSVQNVICLCKTTKNCIKGFQRYFVTVLRAR